MTTTAHHVAGRPDNRVFVGRSAVIHPVDVLGSPHHDAVWSSPLTDRKTLMRSAARLALAMTMIVAAFVGISGASADVPAEGAAADELAVSVVGDGALGNRTVPVQIQTFDGDGGNRTTLATLPTAVAGDQNRFVLRANEPQQGALRQSADRQYVTIGGYDADLEVSGINSTLAPATLRVVGRVDASGATDTSTTLADAYSERHIRGVVSSDGERFWVGGHGQDGPTTKGGVQTIVRGGDIPTPLTVDPPPDENLLNNARVPGIHDGQLYVTSDRAGYLGVNRVDTGLPTTGPVGQTLVAPAPSGSDVPHDFAFIGDHLYVAYTDGATGIARYTLNGSTWEFDELHPGAFWGLTGRVAGDDIVLYATRGTGANNEVVRVLDTGEDFVEDVIATAGAGYAFRGIDFAPGFTPGDASVTPGPALPQIVWDVRVAGGVGNALSAVLGADSNPVATGQITDPDDEDFAVEVSSGDPAVVPDDAVDVDVDDDGRFVLRATPVGAGKTTIQVQVTTDDERVQTASLAYWVSPPLADPHAVAHVGMADASASYEVGDGLRLVADDDSNQIRLYARDFDEPVKEFDFSDEYDLIQNNEVHDFEGAARQGDVIYWVGSLGNTRSGNVRLDRDFVLATRVIETGGEIDLEYVGYVRGIRQALIDWDAANGHGQGADFYGFAAATQAGQPTDRTPLLNVEGVAIAPDDETLWLGFRAPLVPQEAGGNALIVGVDDIAGLVAGGGTPQIGESFELDLGGRGIRDMDRTDDGDYLIIGGSFDDEGLFALFGWSGDAADTPQISTPLPSLAGWPGSYEAIVSVSSLADGTIVSLLQDTGTVDIYDDGTEAQDLTREFMKFVEQDLVLDFGGEFGQAATLELSVDTVRAGGQVDVIASGFGSDEVLTLTLFSDPVALGTLTAAQGGTATGTVTIPVGTAIGPHTIEARSASAVASASLTVVAVDVTTDATPSDVLPSTGTSVTLLALLVALLALSAGIALFRAARGRSGIEVAG